MTCIEQRLYDTALEMSFDFERILGITVKAMFYHFHRSTFKNKSVTPYAIVITDDSDNKHTFMYKDILTTLRYIPSYSLQKNISTELGYVNIKNAVTVVASGSSFAATLKTYYKSYVDEFERMNSQPIGPEVIAPLLKILKQSKITFSEDDKWIHLDNLDVHISKDTSVPSNRYPAVVIPEKVKYFDDIMCIGRFVKYDCKNTVPRDDICLAILDLCPECNNSLVINYEQDLDCPHCRSTYTFFH